MLDQYYSGILMAYGAFMLGLFSPGPNILAVIGTSMSISRWAGVALALGVASGSLLWGLLTLVGLTSLLTFYASVMTVIKIAGGLYLLWLALKAFRSAFSASDLPKAPTGLSGGTGTFFRRGLTVQMTNPKAALTWIAIMSLAMDQDAPLWVGGTVVAGTALISVAGHLVYALAFSTRPLVAAYGKARRWIDGALGAFFGFAGMKLLTSDR